MKGYHYLMRIGHLLNVLVLNAVQLAKIVGTLGARGFIRFIRQTLGGPWLDAEQVRRRLSAPAYLRFVYLQRSDGETHLYDTYSGKKVLVENPLFIRVFSVSVRGNRGWAV